MANRVGASRELGLWSATALVVGHTIGVGIFLTPAELIGAVGSPGLTLGLWLACGGILLAGALTFGELGSRYPQAGGLYVYLREAWGRRIAFLYGWQSLLIMDPGVTAALAIGLAPYLVAVWPAAAGHERWVSLATVWALALLNMSGLRLSSRTLNLLTAFKVLALLAVVAGAFTIGTGSWSHFSPWLTRRPGSPPLGQALGLGLIGAFYSFGGFWEASRVAGEIREPRRTLPRALVTGVAAVTALYALTTLAFAYLVPPEHTVDARDFARRVGQGLLGPAGPGVLAAVVVVSASASILALLLMAPRLYVAMSRDGLFPAALAALSPRTDSPARATALLAALASLLVLTGSFSQVVALFMCTTLVFIGLAAAGLFVVRRRAAGITAFLAPGYPVTPAIFVLLVFVVIGLIALARPIPALAGFVLMLIGVPVYAVLTRRARAGPVSLGGAR
ncbi:MAG TPA: amino acid permease [Thermoanaerobaculia bacterium]